MTASKTKAGDAPAATAKKTTRKKGAAKKAPAKGDLPDADTPQPLPRGQERLPDGTIRLKTGEHELGDTVATYDVHGARLKLSGKVLVASKNVNWLAITKCQKCSTERTSPVNVKKVTGAKRDDKFIAITYTCHNDATCQLGGRLYVAVYTADKVTVG